MKAKYIYISLIVVSHGYLIKLGKPRLIKANHSLVYEIATDNYSIRMSPTYSTDAIFICNSEEEFQSLIAEHKLKEIL